MNHRAHLLHRPTWRDSDRFVPRSVVRPVLRFMSLEAAGGAVMLVAAVAALVWANSPWQDSYERLWDASTQVVVGSVLDLQLTVRDWINEAAMALFFLLAGLEIKRQLLLGELRSLRAAALPAIAALGGMICPALVYLAINAGHPGSGGWGIPVATDIAFAVGVVTLAGTRIPLGARIFILTLAVVDDVGGIIVIAAFYAEGVKWAWLLGAVATVGVTLGLRRADVRSLVPYLMLGSLCWLCLHEAGIEPAIVGVVFGLLTPVTPFYEPARFGASARSMVDQIEQRFTGHPSGDPITDDEREANETTLEDLARLSAETASPLERIENRLGIWVSLLVVPIFAFANAGVRIETAGLDGRVFLGVSAGLVLGKTVGVLGFSWLAVRSGLARLPGATTWRHVFGLAVTAGIGFTVALFVTSLSFTDAALTSSAKLGVLAGSAVAGVLGFLALRSSPSPAPPPSTAPSVPVTVGSQV